MQTYAGAGGAPPRFAGPAPGPGEPAAAARQGFAHWPRHSTACGLPVREHEQRAQLLLAAASVLQARRRRRRVVPTTASSLRSRFSRLLRSAGAATDAGCVAASAMAPEIPSRPGNSSERCSTSIRLSDRRPLYRPLSSSSSSSSSLVKFWRQMPHQQMPLK